MKNIYSKILVAGILMLFLASFQVNAQLFSDNFGTSFTSISTTNWPSGCRGGSPSSFNSTGGYCASSGDYGYGMGGSSQYITTSAITIPAGTCYELSFEYNYNSSILFPDVEIRTGASCGTTVQETQPLGNTGTSCSVMTVDLSAYAGQTIYIRFNSNSSSNFYIDEVSVDLVACGGGGSCVFEDDFEAGTSIDGTKWGCTSGSVFNFSSGCNGRYGYIGSSYATMTTVDIVVPATSPTLTFTYNATNSFCSVLIKTGGTCGSGSYSTIISLPTATCSTMTYDLSAYAGMTVNIQFKSSSASLYVDDVSVCGSGGGSGTGSDYKWADNFEDNDLVLDYAGNDGDEACTGCGNWVLSSGANLITASATVTRNKTEAFPDSDPRTYAVQLPYDEYIESPTIDLSAMESFKVSFYADKQGGSAEWHSWSVAYLQIWDGSAWDNAVTIRNNAAADDSLNNYFIESSFGYHCFTFYKSSSSPGNYYDKGVYVNPAYFTSDFKFRIYFDDFMDNPILNIDNITFRADDDGQSVIPCGISYWNGSGSTYYGQDVNATSTDHSYRGYHLEIDDPFGVGTPPSWSTHANDADSGVGNIYTIVWAVVSEQEVSTIYTDVDFQRTDLTGVTNATMSKDATYTGPGYLYYYKEFADCDGSSVGSYESGPGIQYNFRFEYGIDFRPVYYQLGASGIEYGGGVISLDEQMDMPCPAESSPVKLAADVPFSGHNFTNYNELSWKWKNQEPVSAFVIEKSKNSVGFTECGVVSFDESTQYSFHDYSPFEEGTYYRLRMEHDGKFKGYSETIELKTRKSLHWDVRSTVVSGTLQLELNNYVENGEVVIFDMLGQQSFESSLSGSGTVSFPLENLKPGVYTVRLSTADYSGTKRFVVH